MSAAHQSIETGRVDTYMRVVRDAPFGIYIVDADFRLAEVSQGCNKVFAEIDPVIGRDFAEILQLLWEEPFASECIGHFRNTLHTGEPYQAADTSKPRGNIDDTESYDWKIERITLPDGSFGVVCYFYDLTERIHMADVLRESEDRLRVALLNLTSSEQFSRTMLENSPDCVKILDAGGRLEYVNANGICLLELNEASEILGKHWWTLWPAETHAAIKEAFDKAIAGETCHFQAPCPTAKGTARWWDVIVSPIPAYEGESQRLISVSRDITESKRDEEAVRTARDQLEVKVAERTAELEKVHLDLTNSLKDVVVVQESERQRISRDVHDHLGGTLTGLRLNLESLHAQCNVHDDLQRRIELIQDIAEKLDSDISYLAWMLRPAILDDLGLVPALKSFMGEWSERFGVEATFRAVGVNDEDMDREIGTNLYRITQEALTNIAKHAGATLASVILNQSADGLSLVIEDNGKGISRDDTDPGAVPNGAKHGLGLGGMRDRARLIGASSFEIETSENGTTIIVTVPVK